MESLTLLYANNRGADKPAHARSLISAIVIRCLISMIAKLARRRASVKLTGL